MLKRSDLCAASIRKMTAAPSRHLPVRRGGIDQLDQQNQLWIDAELLLDRDLDDQTIVGDHDAVDRIHRRLEVVVDVRPAA